MARKPAKPKPAPAPKPAPEATQPDVKPQNTEGAENSLKGAQIPDAAEAPQPPAETKPVGNPAGGNEPPATHPPAAEASLSEVLSGVEAPPPAPAAEEAAELGTVTTAIAKAWAEAAAVNGTAEELSPGVLVVIGPKRGRWRAGWHFGPEPRRLPLTELTEEERAAIEGDPALVVSVGTDGA